MKVYRIYRKNPLSSLHPLSLSRCLPPPLLLLPHEEGIVYIGVSQCIGVSVSLQVSLYIINYRDTPIHRDTPIINYSDPYLYIEIPLYRINLYTGVSVCIYKGTPIYGDIRVYINVPGVRWARNSLPRSTGGFRTPPP